MSNNLDHEHALLCLQMLDRIDLKGSEVPAFVKVRNWLHSKTNGEPSLTPPVEVDAQPKKVN